MKQWASVTPFLVLTYVIVGTGRKILCTEKLIALVKEVIPLTTMKLHFNDQQGQWR